MSRSSRFQRRVFARVGFCLITALATGCDAYMRVRQTIELTVTEDPPGAAGSATVDVVSAALRKAASPPDENQWWSDHGQGLRQLPLNRPSRLPVEIAWIAGGIYGDRDVARDRLTGVPYLFRVTSADGQETIPLVLQPGATATQRSFRVTIHAIGKPVQVHD